MIADVEVSLPTGTTVMLPLKAMNNPGEHRYLGKHRRLRVVGHAGGLVRVSFRRIPHKGRSQTNPWAILGDFSAEQAQRLVNVLLPMVDGLCDQLGLPPEQNQAKPVSSEGE